MGGLGDGSHRGQGCQARILTELARWLAQLTDRTCNQRGQHHASSASHRAYHNAQLTTIKQLL